MLEENPYVAPEVDVDYHGRAEMESKNFKDMGFKSLKKLYLRSCNITAIAGLLVLGLCVMAAIFIFRPESMHYLWADSPWVFAIILFQVVSLVGIIGRLSWGRTVGILTCISFLFAVNIISIVIAIVGIVAFSSSPQLFGPHRILHKDLKAEYKYRKKNKILA